MSNLEKAREALEEATKYPVGGGYFVLDKEREEIHSALSAHEQEVAALVEAYSAACAFIDSHVADPDITDEMVETYRVFTEKRAALRPFTGDEK